MNSAKTLLLASAALTLALTGSLSAQDVARENTVIFDLDRTIRDPEKLQLDDGRHGHPPDARRAPGNVGARCSSSTTAAASSSRGSPPGTRRTTNSTEFTLTLREGVMWSDGEAFDADDVVFTVEMAMQNEELTAREGRHDPKPGRLRRKGRRT